MSVYFIQAGRYIKVGYSQNPERRFRRLFASATAYTAPKDTPRNLASRRLLKTIGGDQNTEHLIHAALGDYCVSGEWYIDEPELREWIASASPGPPSSSPAPRSGPTPPSSRCRCSPRWSSSRRCASSSAPKPPGRRY
jgi:hypothetical protein